MNGLMHRAAKNILYSSTSWPRASSWLRWSFGQPGLPFLIAARNGFIIWLNLVLIPAEFAFDMIKAELERRGIRYD
jgi:hypothetical protein